MKDKLSKPEKKESVSECASQGFMAYLDMKNGTVKCMNKSETECYNQGLKDMQAYHNQEIQRVLAEKDKDIYDYKYWRENAFDYADSLKDRVKQLQELKKNECNASLVKVNVRLEEKVKQLEQQIEEMDKELECFYGKDECNTKTIWKLQEYIEKQEKGWEGFSPADKSCWNETISYIAELKQQIKKKNDYIREILILNVELENRFRDKELEENREVSALKTFKHWYLTLGHMNPEALIQLKEIIPEKIFNNLINGDKQ